MIARARMAVPLLCLAVLLPACAEADTGGEPGEMQAPREQSEQEQDEGILYPVHRTAGLGDASFSGRLVIRGNCLVIRGLRGERVWFPVWPASTSFDPEREAIVDEDGEVIVRVGEKMRDPAPTAWVGRELAEEVAGEELPQECDGQTITDEDLIVIGPFAQP